MDMSPVLSVIVPAHNAAEHLGEQLRALVSQSCSHPWKLIVVDHRSTDGTGEVARMHLRGMDNAQVVRVERGSNAAAARNEGARLAHGEMMAFCDADDVVHPGWVQSMAGALTEHDLVVGGLAHDTESGVPSENQGETSRRLGDFFGSPSVAAGNMGVRRWLWDALDGFDESLDSGEDTDFGLRASLDLGVDAYYEDSAIVSVRRRSGTRAIWRQIRTRGQWQPAIMKKHAHRLPHKPKRIRLAFVRYTKLFFGVAGVHKAEGRRLLIQRLALAYGRLLGSLRHRYLYL